MLIKSLYVLSFPSHIFICTRLATSLGGVVSGSTRALKARTSGCIAQMNSPPPLYDRATYSPISWVVMVKVSAPEQIGWMSYVCPFKSSIFPWNCSWPLLGCVCIVLVVGLHSTFDHHCILMWYLGVVGWIHLPEGCCLPSLCCRCCYCLL